MPKTSTYFVISLDSIHWAGMITNVGVTETTTLHNAIRFQTLNQAKAFIPMCESMRYPSPTIQQIEEIVTEIKKDQKGGD